MRSAQKEAEEMIAQAKVRAQQMMEENERRMSAEAERIKANAAREIEQERRTAMEEVRRYAGELGLRSEEHTSELQSRLHLVCRLLLEKKKQTFYPVSC